MYMNIFKNNSNEFPSNSFKWCDSKYWIKSCAFASTECSVPIFGTVWREKLKIVDILFTQEKFQAQYKMT